MNKTSEPSGVPNAKKDGIQEKQEKRYCGIVRPITPVAGYHENHWNEIHDIIISSAQDAGFEGRLVSEDDSVGIILSRIVTNLYDDPITVVDVSSLNANVMFELGMRLAFDKPVVIIKDTLTQYPFDASPLEYIPYPSDLRHAPLMVFKNKLSNTILNTYNNSKSSSYKSFLKHFGSRKPGELGENGTPESEIIISEIQSLKSMFRRISKSLYDTNDLRNAMIHQDLFRNNRIEQVGLDFNEESISQTTVHTMIDPEFAHDFISDLEQYPFILSVTPLNFEKNMSFSIRYFSNARIHEVYERVKRIESNIISRKARL